MRRLGSCLLWVSHMSLVGQVGRVNPVLGVNQPCVSGALLESMVAAPADACSLAVSG